MTVRTRIGLLVPSTNTICEPDFWRVVPPEVTVYTGRLWITNDAEEEAEMDRMNAEVEEGAKYLRTAAVDVVAYGCTTGSFYRGPGYDSELIGKMSAASGAPTVATAPAVVDALRSLGAKRISVATPYTEWNNRRFSPYFEAMGFEVLNVEGEPVAAKAGNQGINDQSPESILDFATKVCRPEADALFCSCTAWRSFEVVQELEQRTGKPVVTSNQATAWAALRVLGISRPDPAFGQLFERS